MRYGTSYTAKQTQKEEKKDEAPKTSLFGGAGGFGSAPAAPKPAESAPKPAFGLGGGFGAPKPGELFSYPDTIFLIFQFRRKEGRAS